MNFSMIWTWVISKSYCKLLNWKFKQMKKFFLLALLCSITGLAAHAQIFDDEPAQQPVGDRVRAARVAYITERLGLTAEQSEKFWALQRQFEADKTTVRQKHTYTRSFDQLTDAEAEEAIMARFAMEEELIALKKKYYQKLKEVVPPRTIARLPRAEREFKQMIIKQIRERRKN